MSLPGAMKAPVHTPVWVQVFSKCGVLIFSYLMFAEVHSASTSNLHLLEGIRPPWLLASLSYGVDLSDTQLKDFLANIPYLGPALIVFCLGARAIREHLAPGNPAALQWYYIVTGVGFIVFLHGTTVLFMFLLIGLNYVFAKQCSKRLPYSVYQTLTWTLHVVLLYVNYINNGYSFAMVSPSLSWLDSVFPGRLRWHVIYNMSTLRMIAFNYDVWETDNFSQEC